MNAALKLLVIGMGALIVLGMGLLVYGFVKKGQDPNWALFSAAAPAPARPAPAQPAPPIAGQDMLAPAAMAPAPAIPPVMGDVKLGLPSGCEIVDLKAIGGLLYVLTQPPGVCGQVLVIDPRAGTVTGRLMP